MSDWEKGQRCVLGMDVDFQATNTPKSEIATLVRTNPTIDIRKQIPVDVFLIRM